MTLLARLQEDMKAAMKAGEKEKLVIIRMLISDVKNIDLQPKKTTEEEAVAAYAKKVRKSAEEYEKLGKSEEVAKLKQELTLVESYLPTKATPEETEKLVADFLAKTPFTPDKVGHAMGAFMKAHGGQVDPAIANAAIKRALTPG